MLKGLRERGKSLFTAYAFPNRPWDNTELAEIVHSLREMRFPKIM